MPYDMTPVRLLICVWIVMVSACATKGPPVQEMSDARQAISAAREAGAATYAGEGLRAAETSLAQAEAQLHQRLYWDARRLALAAKESAFDALLRSRSLREAEHPAAPLTRP
jgi:hypothetical protein